MTLTHISRSPEGTSFLSTSEPNKEGLVELYEELASGARQFIGSFHPEELKARITQVHTQIASHSDPGSLRPTLKWTPQALAFSGVVPLSQIQHTHKTHFS